MALCEGPLAPLGETLNGIGLIWKDLSVYVQLEFGLGSFPGDDTAGGLALSRSYLPFNALAYQGTAYLWGGGYNLGDSAAIGNHNVEVYGPLAGSGSTELTPTPPWSSRTS